MSNQDDTTGSPKSMDVRYRVDAETGFPLGQLFGEASRAAFARAKDRLFGKKEQFDREALTIAEESKVILEFDSVRKTLDSAIAMVAAQMLVVDAYIDGSEDMLRAHCRGMTAGHVNDPSWLVTVAREAAARNTVRDMRSSIEKCLRAEIIGPAKKAFDDFVSAHRKTLADYGAL